MVMAKNGKTTRLDIPWESDCVRASAMWTGFLGWSIQATMNLYDFVGPVAQFCEFPTPSIQTHTRMDSVLRIIFAYHKPDRRPPQLSHGRGATGFHDSTRMGVVVWFFLLKCLGIMNVCSMGKVGFSCEMFTKWHAGRWIAFRGIQAFESA